MKSVVPVVFATDDNYAPYCAVSIASMIANCDPERPYRVYVFYDDLSPEHQEKLSGMTRGNVTVEMMQVTRFVDRELYYGTEQYPAAVYYRFFVQDILTQYDKALYLDSDLVILSDVGALFDIDLGNHLLGAVLDFCNEAAYMDQLDYLKEVLDVTPENYYNSGVLSMNLGLLRKENTIEKCVDFLREHRNLRWMDQDVLNVVCRGRIQRLPGPWNSSYFSLERAFQKSGDVKDINIIHYIGRTKPAMRRFRPLQVYFYQYILLTPYCDELNARVFANNWPVELTRSQSMKNVKTLFARGVLGPRYLCKCCKLWLRGKWRRLRRKLRK